MRPFNLSHSAGWQVGLALVIFTAMATISVRPALAHDDEDGYYRGRGEWHHHQYRAQYYPYGYYYAPYPPPVVVYPAPPPVVYVPPPQPVYVAPPPAYFPLSVGLFFHFR
jgi:hypothetical protein